LAFDVDPVAHALIDPAGQILAANRSARTLFPTLEPGLLLRDLEMSYRPGELRSLIDQAAKEQRAIKLQGVAFLRPDGERWIDLEVVPLYLGGEHVAVDLVFQDVTEMRRLREDLAESGRALEQALEELQSSNEELETTNEELQS